MILGGKRGGTETKKEGICNIAIVYMSSMIQIYGPHFDNRLRKSIAPLKGLQNEMQIGGLQEETQRGAA